MTDLDHHLRPEFPTSIHMIHDGGTAMIVHDGRTYFVDRCFHHEATWGRWTYSYPERPDDLLPVAEKEVLRVQRGLERMFDGSVFGLGRCMPAGFSSIHRRVDIPKDTPFRWYPAASVVEDLPEPHPGAIAPVLSPEGTMTPEVWVSEAGSIYSTGSPWVTTYSNFRWVRRKILL